MSRMNGQDQPTTADYTLGAAWLAWHMVAAVARQNNDKPKSAELAAEVLSETSDNDLAYAAGSIHAAMGEQLRVALISRRANGIVRELERIYRPHDSVPEVLVCESDVKAHRAGAALVQQGPDRVASELRLALRNHLRPAKPS